MMKRQHLSMRIHSQTIISECLLGGEVNCVVIPAWEEHDKKVYVLDIFKDETMNDHVIMAFEVPENGKYDFEYPAYTDNWTIVQFKGTICASNDKIMENIMRNN